MRALIYIAGPYTGITRPAVAHHIALAREMALALVRWGFGYFCPHLNSAHFEEDLPELPIDFWYAMDLRLLEACDAVVLLPGWHVSTGAVAEKAVAEQRGMPVYDGLSALLQGYGLLVRQEEA